MSRLRKNLRDQVFWIAQELHPEEWVEAGTAWFSALTPIFTERERNAYMRGLYNQKNHNKAEVERFMANYRASEDKSEEMLEILVRDLLNVRGSDE